MGKKVGYYLRTSHISQNTSIQSDQREDGWILYVDKGVSGLINFEDRPSGSKLLRDIERGRISMVVTNSCDRMGRNTSSILSNIRKIHSFGVGIRFLREGVTTLDSQGNETPMGNLTLNLLSVLSQFFYETHKLKTQMGIERGKLEGKYRGRKLGSVESDDKFMTKPKVIKIKELLESNVPIRKIMRVCSTSPNTIYKVKEKFGMMKVGQVMLEGKKQKKYKENIIITTVTKSHLGLVILKKRIEGKRCKVVYTVYVNQQNKQLYQLFI